MKTLITISLLFISLSVFAQEEKVTLKEVNYTDATEEDHPAPQTTGMSISTDDIKELRNLDWDLMLSSFEANDPDQEIKISLEFKNRKHATDKAGSKAISVAISGKTSELDSLKKRMEKLTEKMVSSVEKWNK
ncbi:hypothetical protein [Leeuwenhoekiella nanhaiensis]|uniref:Uncharacterized protein n=1 Tax=Leeuwenhoekiella nanhaiensis TaxID=1655491 RepID=A0A2G1VTQ7_9FLAO|nr:hypothetical protein [Leeuwenhoekiella nanhaiensis]PHQ29980.1 hypothetical protein CJ305_08430 [Leeuwenhoekiella nanhaiensis]